MNPRERRLLYALLAVLAAGAAGVLWHQWFWKPYRDQSAALAKLRGETEAQQHELSLHLRDKKLLEEARKKSLPVDRDRAAAEYAKFLRTLLTDAKLTVDDFQGPAVTDVKVGGSAQGAAGKKSSHQALTYTVRAKGEMGQLARALAAMRRAPLMHRVKALTVDRVDTSAGKEGKSRLAIGMVVEALIVGPADKTKDLAASPDAIDRAKLLTETGPRLYADLQKRNLFVGKLPPPEPEPEGKGDEGPLVPAHVRLVSTNPLAREAHLRNLLASVKTPEMRIRSVPRSGYDTFSIWDEDHKKVLIKAKVLRVDHRDVFFQVNDAVFRIHVGQTVAEAMARGLSDDQVEDLGLTSLVDPSWGREEKKAAPDRNDKGGKKPGFPKGGK